MEHILVEPFLVEISSIAKLRGRTARTDLISVLSDIFKAVRRLPLANGEWTLDHRFLVAKKLLHESSPAVLKTDTTSKQASRRPHSPRAWTHHRDSHASVDVNHSSFEELEALPAVGKALAQRIIEERRTKGYFSSKLDLIRRVKGLGEQGYEALQGVFVFSEGETLVISGTFEDDFGSTVAKFAQEGTNHLVYALEQIAMFVATRPHPSSLLGLKRDDLEPGSSRERAKGEGQMQFRQDARGPRLLSQSHRVVEGRQESYRRLHVLYRVAGSRASYSATFRHFSEKSRARVQSQSPCGPGWKG